MDRVNHSAHTAPTERAGSNAASPYLRIMKPLRAVLIALMCVSGGCATVSAVSPNSVNRPAADAQKTDKPSAKPSNKAQQKQIDSQNKDKNDKPAPSHYEDPEDDKDVPCDQIDLGDPGACELVLNDPEADESDSKLS